MRFILEHHPIIIFIVGWSLGMIMQMIIEKVKQNLLSTLKDTNI